MQLLTSEPLVATLSAHTHRAVADLSGRNITPHLAIVLIGSNPDSLTYIDKKQARAKELGIVVSIYHIDENEPHEQAIVAVQHLAQDEEVHGIIVQLPLPTSWTKEQTDELISHIPVAKDVDGLTGAWVSSVAVTTDPATAIMASTVCIPPMVAAVLLLLNHYAITLTDKKIVLVGKGRLVGTPLEHYLHAAGCTVQSVDEETDDILSITTTADILVSGTGTQDLITYQWVQEGAVVIDCAKDVHRDSVDQVAGAVSPAKGGVGPVTVQWLLHNTVLAAVQQNKV